MGCVSSTDADAPTDPTERITESFDQDAGRKHSSISNRSKKHATVTSRHSDYDTELAASLVEGGGSAVAYHGLLLDSRKLSLKRSTSSGNGKIFAKSVHPSDDGNTLEPRLGPMHGGITVIRGTAMTMPYTVIVATSFPEEDVRSIITNVFDDANRTLNGWNPESEISKLNEAPPGKSVQVSSDLLDLFGVIDQMNSITEGRFDPTTGALNVAFENCIKSNARPPLPSEIKPLKYGIGWCKRLQRNGKKIARTNANTVIVLDGISKGFVIDKLVTALVENGCRSCYVDWAGDVRASGNHPSGRPWRSAVLVPPQLRRMFAHWQNGTLKEMLQGDDIGFFANFSFLAAGGGGSIATSGDYFSIQKYGYHHIASSEHLTLLKASQTSVASVCVAAATCAVADAIATAAMTFRTVEAAVEFLKRIQGAVPEQIYGFCVMNRERSQLCSPDTYTSDVFVYAVDTESSTTETRAMENNSSFGVSEETMKVGRKRAMQNITEVHFNNSSIMVDSLAPCSMEPEQLVTFASTVSFVSGASLDPKSLLNKLHGFLLVFHFDGSVDSVGDDKKVRINMRFRKIVEHGKSALVVAAVEAIDLGSASIIEIPCRKGVSARAKMKLGVPRSTLGISPLVTQVKELFRQVPAIVWILQTKSADQIELAITATSVMVPRVLQNMLCFNIAHSSTFFAGIGGLGSRIRGYALSTRQKELANTFITRSNLTLDAIPALESDSVMSADCTIEVMESVQDHIVVLARIKDIRYMDTNQAPLLWLQGCYLDM